MSKGDFKNLLYKFIAIVLRHGCSPVNLLHIFPSTFLKEHLLRTASATCVYTEHNQTLGDVPNNRFSEIMVLITLKNAGTG